MPGLLVLPYVFGAELWPNKIRSFGNTLSQTFSWIFHYAMSYATPSLLADTDNWGAFVFFASWCLVSLLYVYLLVPETAGLTLEEVEDLFTGTWLQTKARSGHRLTHGIGDEEVLEGYYGCSQGQQYVDALTCKHGSFVLTDATQVN